MLRVQALLYRRGPGYRFTVAIRPAASSRTAASSASSSDPALAKTLYKVSFPWTGIWRAYPLAFASDPIVGKGLRSLIGWTWSWRSSLLLCAPIGLVGAVLLLARQPLGSFVSIARLQSSSESSAGRWRSRPFKWSRSSRAGAAGIPRTPAGLLPGPWCAPKVIPTTLAPETGEVSWASMGLRRVLLLVKILPALVEVPGSLARLGRSRLGLAEFSQSSRDEPAPEMVRLEAIGRHAAS
jgi:hypothetical protein